MSLDLRVGRIPFLVCAPYFHDSLAGLSGVHFEDGPPRALNNLLASGEIDCAPSSSFEYARHADRYLLLPGLCTSGRGEVKSVLLLSREPWESLNGKPVALSPHSETSNALFQVLCRFRFGVEPALVSDIAQDETVAQVFIGDPALRESLSGRWPFRYDLAEVWEVWRKTPLPFGLWIVREDAWQSRREAVIQYHRHLRKSLSAFFAAPAAALTEWNRAYPLPMPLAEALNFFDTTDYGLRAEHEEALRDYYGLCREMNLLPDTPTLRYALEDSKKFRVASG